MKVITEDLNARVGKEDIYQSTIEKYNLHEITNDNGQRLINFAASKDIIIGGTFFPYKDIHKGNRTSWIRLL